MAAAPQITEASVNPETLLAGPAANAVRRPPEAFLYGRAVPPQGPPPEEEFPFFLSVGDVYEGPLDLLLALVRKQDLDIFDLPIAKITAQFQAYVATISIEDVDLAAEFTYMAAHLVLVKSRMLLPCEAAKAGTGAKDDPRRELVDLILEHERFRLAAAKLKERQMATQESVTMPGMKRFLEEADPETLIPRITSKQIDLALVFRKCAERSSRRQSMELEQERVTVADMLRYLRRRLAIEDGPVSFEAVIGKSASLPVLSAAFLALLEMSRVGAVYLWQACVMGPILIKKSPEYDDRVEAVVVGD